ncbi:MAG: LamG domain-containing protein [Deltaproteobacteria bacterium]|nr:LamG domain-containing protein [Deltaproteobacteria bacterium]
MTMYRARIGDGGGFQTAPTQAFNVGTGSFTVMAMVSTRTGGTVVARKGTGAGTGNGGFLLAINPDGSIKFVTDDGSGYHQVVTAPTIVNEGNCHTVAGIRDGARLAILLDGLEVPVTASGTHPPPLDIDSGAPLTIGFSQQDPRGQLVGEVMNVSFWAAALSGDLLVRAAFRRVTGSEPNLRGYWDLNERTDDRSPNRNALQSVGAVAFEYCFECIWNTGANAYVFCCISNYTNEHVPSTTKTISKVIDVPIGSSVFGMSILQHDRDFPFYAEVVLTDPQGRTFNQDQNTETLFTATRRGQPWAVMVVNPTPGPWRVQVSNAGNEEFHLYMGTIPTTAVVQTSVGALTPLYPWSLAANDVEGWWGGVISAAVGLVAGVVVVAAIVVTGGAAIPAVATGVAVFGMVSYSMAAAMLPSVDTSSAYKATEQLGGFAGFIVAPDKLLLMDANVDADRATQIMYRQRSRKLYTAVTASPFNKVQAQLVGADMKQAKVAAQFQSFASGYVSSGGHGRPTYQCGWYVSDPTGPLEEVLSTSGSARFVNVANKIIHLFACHCGAAGTADRPGLGRAMVSAGAVAFFGYNVGFVLNVNQAAAFCDCDIKIDLALIGGGTCDDAYRQAIALYNSTIARLKVDGDLQAAAQLEGNRDALVSPSTNAMYGNRWASLKTS